MIPMETARPRVVLFFRRCRSGDAFAFDAAETAARFVLYVFDFKCSDAAEHVPVFVPPFRGFNP